MAGIKILQNKSLKVTPPNEFNDPFEFATRVTGEINPEWLRKIHQDEVFLRESYESLKHRLQGKTFELFREEQSALANDHDSLKDIVGQATLLHQDWGSHFLDQVSLGAGIVCFTEDKHSILMWSHYASNHEGFMIGFDVDKFPFVKIFKVDYSRQEPTEMDLHFMGSAGYIDSLYLEILKRKAPCWSYEKEYRLQFVFDICKYLPKIQMYFYEFDPAVVREVYIGNKCRKADRETVQKLLNQSEFSHVKVYEAQLSKDHYMIEYTSLQ